MATNHCEQVRITIGITCDLHVVNRDEVTQRRAENLRSKFINLLDLSEQVDEEHHHTDDQHRPPPHQEVDGSATEEQYLFGLVRNLIVG